MLINKKLSGSLDTVIFPGLSYIGIVPYTIHAAKRGSPVLSPPYKPVYKKQHQVKKCRLFLFSISQKELGQLRDS